MKSLSRYRLILSLSLPIIATPPFCFIDYTIHGADLTLCKSHNIGIYSLFLGFYAPYGDTIATVNGANVCSDTKCPQPS